jgi:hypothetical protein
MLKDGRKLHFITYLVLCCVLLMSCGKEEIKNSPRCLYDQPVFAEVALSAVADDLQFSQFKRSPFFNLFWENHTFEEGKLYLDKISTYYPSLEEKFDQFRQNDQIGLPRTHFYRGVGFFSPSTLRFVAIAGDVQSRV